MVIAFGNSIKLHINYKTKQVIYQDFMWCVACLLFIYGLLSNTLKYKGR